MADRAEMYFSRAVWTYTFEGYPEIADTARDEFCRSIARALYKIEEDGAWGRMKYVVVNQKLVCRVYDSGKNGNLLVEILSDFVLEETSDD